MYFPLFKFLWTFKRFFFFQVRLLNDVAEVLSYRTIPCCIPNEFVEESFFHQIPSFLLEISKVYLLIELPPV